MMQETQPSRCAACHQAFVRSEPIFHARRAWHRDCLAARQTSRAELLRDSAFVVGFALLVLGVWKLGGAAASLIVGGGLIMAYSVVGSLLFAGQQRVESREHRARPHE